MKNKLLRKLRRFIYYNPIIRNIRYRLRHYRYQRDILHKAYLEIINTTGKKYYKYL